MVDNPCAVLKQGACVRESFWNLTDKVSFDFYLLAVVFENELFAFLSGCADVCMIFLIGLQPLPAEIKALISLTSRLVSLSAAFVAALGALCKRTQPDMVNIA
jgi:hypothetical protein